MEPFDFYYQGFKTKYRAVPMEQTYVVYASGHPVTHFEQGEMQQMIKQGKVVKAYDEENVE